MLKKRLMDLDELLWLVGSAVKYVESFPEELGEDFVRELREIVGMGFTNEQFETIKSMVQREKEMGMRRDRRVKQTLVNSLCSMRAIVQS
jgi:hypothetical protein